MDFGDIDQLVGEIDRVLQDRGTPERAEREKAYLKSRLRHYGATLPDVRAAVKLATRQRPGWTHADVVACVEALWAKPVHERRMAAVELLILDRRLLVGSDLALVERLLRESCTWALVDGLATKVVGYVVEQHPESAGVLDRWAVDNDFWIRRSALLALLEPLREGAGDFPRFARYADAMLDETEFFVRKAIGWVLRDTAKKRPELVASWLLPRAARASGVTVREAVKYLTPDQRTAILAARTR